jgi:FixJ family two-component response regulator
MIASAESESIVFVIDDDASIRETLKSLFESVGQQVAVFDSPSEFLQTKMPDMTSCLVLDIRLRGSSGLEFQAELIKSNLRIPIIFLSAHGDDLPPPAATSFGLAAVLLSGILTRVPRVGLPFMVVSAA